MNVTEQFDEIAVFEKIKKLKLDTPLTDSDVQSFISYEREIFDALNSPTRKIVLNDGRAKATCLMTEMLGDTCSNIDMVVGSLAGPISNQPLYTEAFKKCIANGVATRIVFLHQPNTKSELYQILAEDSNKPNSKTSLYQGFEGTRNAIIDTFQWGEIHFAIYDKDKCRIENIPDEYVGFGIFNDIGYVSKFSRFFSETIMTTVKKI